MLAGWVRSYFADGVHFAAPNGDGWIRIRPCVRELVRPCQLLENARLVELVTDEGELAVIASAPGATMALVGDDPHLVIDAVGRDGHCALVEQLARELRLGLGARRQRWFRYTPPHDWIGVRGHRCTHWLHPRYPRVRARITVQDARPVGDPTQDHVEHMLRMEDELAATPTCIEGYYGLVGRSRTAIGTTSAGRTRRSIAALTDAAFLYVAHFEGPDDAKVAEAFSLVVASFQPLPAIPSEQRAHDVRGHSDEEDRKHAEHDPPARGRRRSVGAG